MKRLDKVHARSASRIGELNISRSLPLCLLLLFVAAEPVRALDPHKLITQYGHTAWRTRDGYVDAPAAITQTADGYIWIGTRNGLIRFDGVRFTPWIAPDGQALPSKSIGALLGARDGSLWIGTTGGLSQLKDGRLVDYAAQTGRAGIAMIIEDEAGTVWFTRYRIADGKGPLCRMTDEGVQCYGKADGIPVTYGLGLAKDGAGAFWFGSSVLCRWAQGSSSTYFEEELKHTGGNGVIDVAVGPSGSVWATLDGIGPGLGVRYFSDGKWASYVVPGFNGAAVRSHTLFMDRHHSLWVGTESEGLYHIHDGIADHYGIADGLSGNSVGSIYEDSEGNLWVVTNGGVDSFRDTPVVSFSSNEGLSGANIHSVLALRNGAIWVGNGGGLDVLRDSGRPVITSLKGTPGQDVGAMCEDRTGRIWLGVDDRLMTYEHGQFSEVRQSTGAPLGHVGSTRAVVEDVDANIWAVVSKNGKRRLLRIKDRSVEEEIALENIVGRAMFLAADRQAGIWIGSSSEKLARYRNGKMEFVSLGEGEDSFTTYSLFVDSDNALWAATSKGLYRWQDGRLNLMDSRNGLPCASVFAVIEDSYGAFWLYAQCGLLKISAADLATWRERPESNLSVRVFDPLDGALPGTGEVYQSRAIRSPDGRLWFVNGSIAQMIDPSRSYTNEAPPPVHIEELVADHKRYDPRASPRLPPLRGELEIDYTALSLTIPRKVNFRYRLEGHDTDWRESGIRRQAFYNDLPPGPYRFRVTACNNDGVWNEVGATLDFSIAPTWYQTTAVRLSFLLFIVLVAWGLYRLRIRQVARAISVGFDERLAERTRLARELHDTLLQTVQGSKMVADDALERPADPVRMRHAMEKLSVWLGQAMQEGRAALNSLRTSTTERNDLAEAFQRATETCLVRGAMSVNFSVVGEAREMHPIVRDEVYRIGYEAIRNACVHSGASQLAVELRYAQDLAVRVSDNGMGIPPAVADQGKDGHFGLQGMRERAARIGGKLSIVSSANAGTEVTIVVPGSFIFRKAGATRLKKIKALFRR